MISAGTGATLLALGLGPSLATAVQEEPVYGRQLMTPEEIAEHRAKMRSLATQQERVAYRQGHHERLQERAKEMRMALPEAPGPQGKGMGPGYGQSRGMGAQRSGDKPGGGQLASRVRVDWKRRTEPALSAAFFLRNPITIPVSRMTTG